MIRRFIAALLVLTVTFFGFIQPSYAAPQYNSGSSMIQGQDYIGVPVSSNPVANCWHNKPANALEDMSCDAAKTIGGWGFAYLVCTGLDAAATSVFPPAVAAAPLCSFLTAGRVAVGGRTLVQQGIQAVIP